MELRKYLVFFLLMMVAAVVQAEEMHDVHKVVTSDSLEWKELKSLPPAKVAVIIGDPAKEGLFTIRLSIPSGVKVLPHWHPSDEHVTVLTGTMRMGMGDKFDPASGKSVPAGGYSFMPAKVHHYAWFDEESVIQITGMGPWKIIYVNPEDDPANKTP
jgi:hypothetical protein